MAHPIIHLNYPTTEMTLKNKDLSIYIFSRTLPQVQFEHLRNSKINHANHAEANKTIL
jgi:hypothetical protein